MSKLRIIVVTVLLLCFFGTIALAEGNSSESVQASSMRLMQTEGNVTLTDQNGAILALRNRMRLYSGYTTATGKGSRAEQEFFWMMQRPLPLQKAAQQSLTRKGKNLKLR